MDLSPTTLPAPLEPAPRWARAPGVEPDRLRVERDDLTGLGGGGNKTRELQVSVEAALDAGATALVTTGAPQSDHARLTAAAGARAGLRVVLVLEGSPPEVGRGNLLLDALFGAEVLWSGDRALEVVRDEAAEALRAGGERPHVLPFGGSSPESATAYREAAREVLGRVLAITGGVAPLPRAVSSGAIQHRPYRRGGPDGPRPRAVRDRQDTP